MGIIKQYWRLGGVLYKELVFQSTYPVLQSMSTGHLGARANELVKNAMVNVLVSKIMYSIGLILTSIIPYLDLLSGSSLVSLQTLSARVSSIILVAMILFLFAGIQEFASIGRVKIADFLLTHPISTKDASTLMFLAIIRAYDIPIAAFITTSILIYSLIFRSIVGSIIYLATILITILLSLALSLYMGTLFSRIVFGEKKSFVKRLILLIIWVTPYYMIYLLYNTLPRLYMFMEQSAMSVLDNPLIMIIYPFPFAMLTASLTLGVLIEQSKVLTMLGGLTIYSVVFAYVARWVNTWIKNLSIRSVSLGQYPGKGYLPRLKIRNTYLALISKDLALGLRNPGVFLVLTMPAGITVIYWAIYEVSRQLIFFVSLWTLFYIPVLFFIEQHFYLYSKTLPLDDREIVYAKVLFASLIYALIYIVLLILASILTPHRLIELMNSSFTLISNPSAYLFYSMIGLKLFGTDMYSGNIYSKLGKILPLMISTIFINSLPWGVYEFLSSLPIPINPLIIVLAFSTTQLILIVLISHIILRPRYDFMVF